MIQHNWLVNYQYTEGIARILFQMDQRTKNNSQMQYSVEELNEFYTEFESEFTLFFEDLRTYVNQKLLEL